MSKEGKKVWRRPGEKTKEELDAMATEIPEGVGTGTFLHSKPPAEVSALVPLLHATENKIIRKILEAVVNFIKVGHHTSHETYNKLKTETGLQGDTFDVIFSGLLTLISRALRSRMTSNVIEKGLLELNIPKDPAADISKIISNRRMELETTLLQHRVRPPSLSSFKWRVDVTLSNNLLSRVMKPSVLMSLTLSNGQVKNFEVPIDSFDKLRYNVASVLKQMKKIENHPIMSVVDADIERDRHKSVSTAGKK